MKAFLLAAGLGTRLRPMSLELPKPAWPLFDVPLAAHVLRMLEDAGVTDVVINLHHLGERLRDVLTPWIPDGVRVCWSPEDPILGTGGALAPWRESFSDAPFFLANADTYQEVDLEAMSHRHRASGGLATLALRPVSPREEAPIEVDGSGRIVRFLGARAPEYRPGTPCEFTGLHVLEPELLGHLPEGPCCINADVHAPCVKRGARLFGYIVPQGSFWSDLGTPDRYLCAHEELLARRRPPPASKGRLTLADGAVEGGGTVLAPSYLGPAARVEGGAVAGPYAVLGADARVGGGARVERSVVWAGARIEGGVVRCAVVSPSGSRISAEDEARGRVGSP